MRRAMRSSGRARSESRGPGEILLTSMVNGTRSGFDCEMTAAVAMPCTPRHCIRGAGGLEHFCDVFTRGHADAALAASSFHYADASVSELKRCFGRSTSRTDVISLSLRPGLVITGSKPRMLIPSIDLQADASSSWCRAERLADRGDRPRRLDHALRPVFQRCS